MKAFRFITIATLAFLGSSCAKEMVFEPVAEDPNLIPLNISGSIDQVATRATAAGFVNGDAVGLFAVNYTENNTIAGTLAAEGNQADNVKYVFDETNYKWVPVKPVYYKDINTHADLYLYYPYESTISDVNAVNFEVKKDQSAAATATELSGYEASDWMWGKAEDITPSQSSVQIPLKHKLSAIQLTLNEGTGWDEGEFAAQDKGVIVTNTTRKATLDYSTGEVDPVGAPQLDGIVMCPQTDGTFRAVVIPQTVDAGTSLFSITVNGISYSFTQNNPVSYQQGKQLNVSINIKKKTPAGDFELELADAQIVPWTEDLNTHGGEARQYFVVNVETPGTLGATIEAMQKNPAKIRNLKVTGIVNADDFYFMRDDMDILEAVNMKECQPMIEYSIAAYTDSPNYDYYIQSYGEPTYIDENGTYRRWDLNRPIIPNDAFNSKNTLSFFVFPEEVTEIGDYAFYQTKLAGALIIPDDVVRVGQQAFSQTLISSVSFPLNLKRIDYGAFAICTSLSGSLSLPETLSYIGDSAFQNCSFSGHLSLPENLSYLGGCAFNQSGSFSGDLVIPAGVKVIYTSVFSATTFTGQLIFKGNLNFDEHADWAFAQCHFSGDLHLPNGMSTIPNFAFYDNNFTSITLPSTLKEIKSEAFQFNHWLERVNFSEGLFSIGERAFNSCANLLSLKLPSTLQTIQDRAFEGCFYISNISCDAVEPPTVMQYAFDGVAKDNFAVQVPEQSIIRYQTENGWSDFRRIIAHCDFSIGRTRLRLLNKGESRTYTLRCPSGNDWSIESKPDWVTITPSSGSGKTDVTITVSDMARTSETFEVNNGSFQYPNYANYAGRNGDIVFKIDGMDYTCKLTVEQFDYDFEDGQAITLQSATAGNGIDIVFIGEGFDAKDIADGKFTSSAATAFGHFFNVEPYTTYKDYFNVYSVISKSDDSGIEDVNTVIDNKLDSVDACFLWAKKADSDMDLSQSVVIMLQNNPNYYGWTYMYGDGSALAVVPISEQAYPRDFRGLIQHEAGGHAFGKLADEYIYHNAFISNCICPCCDHPTSEYDLTSQFGFFKSLGWYKNLSTYSDHNRVPWAHLVFNPDYSNRVDMFEGGYMHTRGIYRSEITSCMNNNIPYFSAISRQAIVERIKDYAGETFSLEDFYAHDSFAVGTRASDSTFDWTFGVDPNWSEGPEHGSIIYMGDHPNVK